MTSPKWYDCTIPRENLRQSVVELKEGKIDDISWVAEKFDEKCERWVIGVETGKADLGEDLGYSHFQCRVVFKKEWDIKYVIQWFPWGHWSATHVRDFHYVEKEGNYVRSWEKALQSFVDLTPTFWQLTALGMLEKQSDREVLVILDEKGRHGKSWLRKHLVATHKARYIPPMQTTKDMMRACMASPSVGYVFDLPRAEGAVNSATWSTIEQVKDGYLYDDRYTWKEMWIKPPRIIVFCNSLGKAQLSPDRFDIFDITDYPQEARGPRTSGENGGRER